MTDPLTARDAVGVLERRVPETAGFLNASGRDRLQEFGVFVFMEELTHDFLIPLLEDAQSNTDALRRFFEWVESCIVSDDAELTNAIAVSLLEEIAPEELFQRARAFADDKTKELWLQLDLSVGRDAISRWSFEAS